MDKDKLADELLEKFLKQGLGFPRFRGDVWETIADYILENFVPKEPQTKEPKYAVSDKIYPHPCEHERVSLYGGDWNCLKCNATSWKTPEDYKPKPKPKLPSKIEHLPQKMFVIGSTEHWLMRLIDGHNEIIDFLGGGGE